MNRVIYIGAALTAFLAGWILFLSPALSEYNDARDRNQAAEKNYLGARDTGYRVSDDDESRLTIADSEDWTRGLVDTGYSIVEQSGERASFIGPEETLPLMLERVTGDDIVIDPIYGVMRLPAEIMPIVPIAGVELKYLSGGQVQLNVNPE
jgi:hypothetical protein